MIEKKNSGLLSKSRRAIIVSGVIASSIASQTILAPMSYADDEPYFDSSATSTYRNAQVKYRPITEAQRQGKNEDNSSTKYKNGKTKSTRKRSSTNSNRKTSSNKTTSTRSKSTSGSGLKDYSDGGIILPDDYYDETVTRTITKKRKGQDSTTRRTVTKTEIVLPPGDSLDDIEDSDTVILPPSNPDLGELDLDSLDVSYDGSTAEQAVEYALSKLGSPYVWGAEGPDTFDCSGLMQWAYGKAGLPITRTTYTQINDGPRISLNDVKPGDLVFYRGIEHVGMAISSTEVVHAPQTGDVVKISDINMMPIDAIVRVAE